MRFGEISLELILSFVGYSMAFPNLAVFHEHVRSMDELEGVVGDLLGSVGREVGGSVIDVIFDLVEKGFD